MWVSQQFTSIHNNQNPALDDLWIKSAPVVSNAQVKTNHTKVWNRAAAVSSLLSICISTSPCESLHGTQTMWKTSSDPAEDILTKSGSKPGKWLKNTPHMHKHCLKKVEMIQFCSLYPADIWEFEDSVTASPLCLCAYSLFWAQTADEAVPPCLWYYSSAKSVHAQQAHEDFFCTPTSNITGLMDHLGFTQNMEQCVLWLLFMIAVMKLLCWFSDFRVRVMCALVHVCVLLCLWIL